VAVVIFGLTQASSQGWLSAQTLTSICAGLALMAAFVLWELRQEQPLLDVRVLADRAFTAALGVSLVLNFALYGATFLIPVFLQQVQGYDTLSAGLLIAAQGIGAAIVMPVSGYLTDRFGARPVVFFGVAVMASVSILMTTASPSTPRTEWVLLLSLRGVGIGFGMMPSFSAAYITIAAAAIGRATALSNTLQRVAASFGVAVLATVTATRVAAHTPPGLPHLVAGRGFLSNAMASGFDDALWLAAGVALLGLPASILLRRARPAGLGPLETADRLAPRLRRLAGGLTLLALAGLALSIGEAFGIHP